MCRKILPSNQRTLCVQTLFLNTPIFNNSVVTKLSICCLSFVWQYITTCYPAWIIPRPERKSNRTSQNNKSPTEKRIFFPFDFSSVGLFSFYFFSVGLFFFQAFNHTINNFKRAFFSRSNYFNSMTIFRHPSPVFIPPPTPRGVAMSFAYERLLTSVTFVLSLSITGFPAVGKRSGIPPKIAEVGNFFHGKNPNPRSVILTPVVRFLEKLLKYNFFHGRF